MEFPFLAIWNLLYKNSSNPAVTQIMVYSLTFFGELQYPIISNNGEVLYFLPRPFQNIQFKKTRRIKAE